MADEVVYGPASVSAVVMADEGVVQAGAGCKRFGRASQRPRSQWSPLLQGQADKEDGLAEKTAGS